VIGIDNNIFYTIKIVEFNDRKINKTLILMQIQTAVNASKGPFNDPLWTTHFLRFKDVVDVHLYAHLLILHVIIVCFDLENS